MREPDFLAGRDEVIKNLAKLLDPEVTGSAYEAEALGSVVLGFLIAPGIPEDSIVRIVLDVIDELERRSAGYSYAALRVLAVVGPQETTEYAAQAARRIADRQPEHVSQPSWIVDLGNVMPGACHLAASPAGDETVVSCSFTYADGTRPHLVWAVLDHAWHGAPSVLVMAEDRAEALAMMKKYAREDGAEVREVPAAKAAPLLLAGIGALIEHGPPPESDRKDKFFSESCSAASLARSRVALLIDQDEKVPDRAGIEELWTAGECARLVDEFLASPQASALTDLVSRTMPKLLVSLTVRHLGCDPRVLSVRGLTRILLRTIPAIAAVPDSFGAKFPSVVRAWTEWLAERRGLDKDACRRISRAVERLLRQFPACWNGPLASPLRRYVQDVPDEVACDGDLLMPLLERREFAVPLPDNRANGVVQVKSRRATRHASELDAASASDRALITVNDLNGRGVPQYRFDSYVAVVEQLWAGDPPETWATAKRMLAAGKPRTAVLDRLARDHEASSSVALN